MDFSPSGDCLATGLVDEKGIFLWSNTSMYNHLTLNKSPDKPTHLTLPCFEEVIQVKTRKAFYQQKSNLSEPMTDQEDGLQLKNLLNIADKCENNSINFSSEPFTKWQTIYNLESIKEKNKPLEPPKDPPPAPFFLYDIDKATDDLALKNLLIDQPENNTKRILKKNEQIEADNEILKLLKLVKEQHENKKEIYEKITSHLKNISGSRSELEFGELNSLTGEYKEEVSMCIDYFIYAIEQKQDYELVQAHLHVFLKNCADMLQSPENEGKMKLILNIQKKTWEGMQRDLTSSMFLVDFFSGIQLT